MADQSSARFADVVAISQDRDIALLKIRGYQGPQLAAIDGRARALAKGSRRH